MKDKVTYLTYLFDKSTKLFRSTEKKKEKCVKGTFSLATMCNDVNLV